MDRRLSSAAGGIRSYTTPGKSLSRFYRLKINGLNVPVAATPGLEPGGEEHLFAAYRQLPSYCWVEARDMSAHYAVVGCDGEVTVELETNELIQSFAVYPSRRKISAVAAGNTLHFTIDRIEPRYYIVAINQLPYFCLLIDPLDVEPDLSAESFVDIRKFIPGGLALGDLAEGVRLALPELNESGNTLYIPPGEYKSGCIKVANVSRFNLYLAAGALIRTRVSSPESPEHLHGLWLDNCQDIRVLGHGVIDHQGYEQFAGGRIPYQHGLVGYVVPNSESPFISQSPLCITRCSDVLVEGLTVRNSRNFNVNLRRNDRVTLRRVKVVTASGSVPEYTDGFQINSCHDTLLENCFALCSDDCIASGHYFYSIDDRDNANTKVSGFVGTNPRANAVRLGFYTHYNLGDFTFTGCDFVGPDDSAVLIHSLADAPEAGRYQRYGVVRFLDCGFDRTDRYAAGLIVVEKARMAGLEFVRCMFDSKPAIRSNIKGLDEKGISSLVIRKMRIANEGVTDLEKFGIVVSGIGDIVVENEECL